MLHHLLTIPAAPSLSLIEGAMGLFDGAGLAATHPHAADGSTASIAKITGWPVILVIDAGRMAESFAAIVHGFATLDPDITIGGIIINRVGSPRHTAKIRAALAAHASVRHIPVLGALPRMADTLPSRHLGLVQAQERPDLHAFIATMAHQIRDCIDLPAVVELAQPLATPHHQNNAADVEHGFVPPLGQRIAIAQDAAFSFIYPHLLAGWRAAGASLHFFSPLKNEAPDAQADAVYLPGGYPELHAATLATATHFRRGMHAAQARGCWIFGECGGYMALGDGLVDKQGTPHRMLGLLPLETSFAKRALHLGYRMITPLHATPLGNAPLYGHEFHYATTLRAGAESAPCDDALFLAQPADNRTATKQGLANGRVFGSFMHIIAAAAAQPAPQPSPYVSQRAY
jgi:cobyrinic acid a,c-diamide synthase